MARTRSSRTKGKSPFSLKSGNASTFKLMGSGRSPYPMGDARHPGAIEEPIQKTGEEGGAGAVMVGMDGSPLSKSDSALVRDYGKDRKASSPYRKDEGPELKGDPVAANQSPYYKKESAYKKEDDDKPEKTEVEKPEPAVREDTDENVTFENVPDPDREDGGFRQDAGDYVPEQGDDLTGTDYEYANSGKIVRRDDTSDIEQSRQDRDTDVHGIRGGVDAREAGVEGASEDEDVSWSESRHHLGSNLTHSPVTGDIGRHRVDHFDETTDEQGRSQGAYETHYRTGLGGPSQEERLKESEHGEGNLSLSDRKYGNPIAEDPFANNRVIGTDRDGNPVFADTSQQIFDDIYVPTGLDESDYHATGEHYSGDWTGFKGSKNRRQEGFSGKYDDIHDNPYGMDWDQHAEDITNRTTTGFNPILGGKYEGGEMKVTTGQKGSGSNLISKKVVKTEDGDRIVEKHKEGRKGSFVRNRDTGELEWRENRRTKSKKDVFNPETQKWERKTYVDGREWTPEYKQELKDAKKKYKQNIKDEKKEEKRKKKEEHDATKHLYKGMNANEANTAENKHREEASAMGLTYKEYAEKHLPPPPKDDSILGLIKNRKQNRIDREERKKNRTNYDDYDYSAYNEPY